MEHSTLTLKPGVVAVEAGGGSSAPNGCAPRPTIVCLCGSTRFYEAFQAANYRETMAGKIVLSVGFYPHASEKAHGEEIGITAEQKLALDELHKRKIDLCDEVLVLNCGGYIGKSTASEVVYATERNKPVKLLEPFLLDLSRELLNATLAQEHNARMTDANASERSCPSDC